MKAALKVGREKFAVVDVDTPSIGKNDVLVEVHYCLICAWCYETWLKDDTQSPLGPGISGHEVSGVVKEIGSGVRNFKTGDNVLVYDLIHCGECEECNAGKETFCKSSLRKNCFFARKTNILHTFRFPERSNPFNKRYFNFAFENP